MVLILTVMMLAATPGGMWREKKRMWIIMTIMRTSSVNEKIMMRMTAHSYRPCTKKSHTLSRSLLQLWICSPASITIAGGPSAAVTGNSK